MPPPTGTAAARNGLRSSGATGSLYGSRLGDLGCDRLRGFWGERTGCSPGPIRLGPVKRASMSGRGTSADVGSNAAGAGRGASCSRCVGRRRALAAASGDGMLAPGAGSRGSKGGSGSSRSGGGTDARSRGSCAGASSGSGGDGGSGRAHTVAPVRKLSNQDSSPASTGTHSPPASASESCHAVCPVSSVIRKEHVGVCVSSARV